MLVSTDRDLLLATSVLYASWIIVLAGSQVAFYVQNPELVRHGLKRNEVGGRTMERVALSIMYLIGRAYEKLLRTRQEYADAERVQVRSTKIQVIEALRTSN